MRKRLHNRVQFQKSCLVRICFFFVFVVVVVVVPCRVQDERLLDNNPPRRSLVTARLSEWNPRLLLRRFLRKEPCSRTTMDAWHSVSIVVVLVLLKVLEPASHQLSRCRADLLVLLLLLLLPPHRTHKRVCGDNLWIFCFIAIDVSDLRSSRERKSEHLEAILHATTPLRTCFCALSRFLFSQLRFSWSHAGKETPFRFLFLLVPLRIHHRVLYLIAKPKVEFCIVIFSLIAFIMDWLTIISCCSSSIRRRRRKRKEEGANASSVSLAVSCSCRSTNNHVSCIDYIGIWSQVPSLCTLDGSSDCSLFCMLQCLDHQPL